MPCLNEAATVAQCVAAAQAFLSSNHIQGEIIVADNGSTDGSQALASQAGARVVPIGEKGYGSALMGGIEAAQGRFIIMGDADCSYDFSNLMPFVEKLREGYDLVMGNRFRGGIQAGAMPWHHYYIGNPILTMIGRFFFKTPSRDFHCGLRGFTKAAAHKMDLRTTGMEFASEMVVKASLLRFRVCEVPTTLAPDGRNRKPHLRSFRDGWRHLRFLLLFSPRWLFFYPGLTLMSVGLFTGAWLLPGPRQLGNVTLDIHTLLYMSLAVLIGFQLISFGLFSKVFAISQGLHPITKTYRRLLGVLNLEVSLAIGFLLFILGIVLSLFAVGLWRQHSFGDLNPQHTLRWVIPSSTCLAFGVQVMFLSFFLRILGLKHK